MRRMALLSVLVVVIAGLFISTGLERGLSTVLSLSWLTLVGLGLLLLAVGLLLVSRVGRTPVMYVGALAVALIILGSMGVGN